MAPWIGSKEVAFLLAEAPDLPPPPPDWEAAARQKIFADPSGADLRTYIHTVSYGKAHLDGDIFGPYQTNAKRPHDGSWDLGDAMGRIIAAAITAQPLLAKFRYFCVIFTDHRPAPSWAFMSTRRCYVDMEDPLGVIAMENLHALTSFGDLYGPPDQPRDFDVMACACGTHPSAFTKLDFSWLDPNTVANVVPASGVSNLTVHALSLPLDPALAPSRVHAVKLKMPLAAQYYLLEARMRTDRYERFTAEVSSGIPAEGIVIYWIDESSWPPVHLRQVLRAAGDSFNDQAKGITITLTAPVDNGYAVAINRVALGDCARIQQELTDIEAEIDAQQEELKSAPTNKKGDIARVIKQLQSSAKKLRQYGQELGCPL